MRVVKADGKTYQFVNGKCAKAHLAKRNPRKVNWTVLYRRKHKKGVTEEVAKKRTRRTTKYQRAIQGATINDILAKRNQKPEVRQAQREQAIKAAKEKQKAKDAQKKTTKPPQPKAAQKPKVAKAAPKSQARVAVKR
jgi:large subunit ribosomal protein L24e